MTSTVACGFVATFVASGSQNNARIRLVQIIPTLRLRVACNGPVTRRESRVNTVISKRSDVFRTVPNSAEATAATGGHQDGISGTLDATAGRH